ncbi:hypothetical protein [Caballeronia glebae]|jgi:hypothetical protein|uniref:hypothetical protein n=1 Tax=Caballeronia glebae TaxID=1777143 RepID=UPI000AE49C2A|nr:hypothetical protein [Caballeronia glebae]
MMPTAGNQIISTKRREVTRKYTGRTATVVLELLRRRGVGILTRSRPAAPATSEGRTTRATKPD